jgi:hypothetical protein
MRYFLFSYTYNSGNGNLFVESAVFPQKSWLREVMSENAQEQINNIVISGWCEFKNKQDADNFNR